MEAIERMIRDGSRFMNAGVTFPPGSTQITVDPLNDSLGRYYNRDDGAVDLNSAYLEATETDNVMYMETKTNGVINYTYTSTAWDDRREKYITKGTILFGQKFKHPEDAPLTPILTLATLNSILSKQNDLLKQAVRDNDPDAVAFNTARNRDDFDEKLLYAFNQARRKRVLEGEYKTLYELASQPRFACLSRCGILSMFRYLGAAHTDATGGGLSEIRSMMYSHNLSNINVTSAKYTQLANIWGGSSFVKPNAKLYLVLEKVTETGAYRIVPRASTRKSAVLSCDEHLWYVGKVIIGAIKTPSNSDIIDAISSTNPLTAYKGVGKLEMIDVALGV
jgi:hypothetical protein